MTDPLTEAERAIVKAAANYGAWSTDEEGNDFDPDETVDALLAIIDRLSADPVDDTKIAGEAPTRKDGDARVLTDVPPPPHRPAPVGLTEDERAWVSQFRKSIVATDRRFVAIIDRLSTAPVDHRERVPEGWRVEPVKGFGVGTVVGYRLAPEDTEGGP